MRDEQRIDPTESSQDPDDSVERAITSYLDRMNSGEELDAAELLAENLEWGERILEGLEQFVELGQGGPNAPLGALGDYTLRRQIGRGGMGVVYEAWENSMDRRVALKVLPAGIAADTRASARFLREAQTAGKLSHPNVVPVYFTGVKDQTPFYAMEYVEGETLAQVLGKIKEVEPEAETVFGRKDCAGYFENFAAAFAEVADGLQHAHSKGVTHRDIKPSNLILDHEGRLRILDFGLARLEGQESLTLSGDFIGTPAYMSPEQAKRRKIPVDHRTDIYSLGATMYELITHEQPFRGKDHQDTLSQIIERDPRPPRQLNARVPVDLETIVLKCLRKETADRYGTAEALGQDLRRFVRGDPIEAGPQPAWERLARRLRRHKTAALLATITLFLSAPLLIGLRVWHHERLTELQTAAQGAVRAAEESLAAEEYDLATGRLTEARSRLSTAPKTLMPLRRRIEELLHEAEAERRIGRFRRLADDARRYAYYDSEPRQAKSLCEEALDLYTLLPPATGAKERLPPELEGDVFELLVILAGAQARDYRFKNRGDFKNAEAKEAALKTALATLTEAESWRTKSPALHAYRARFKKRLGDEEGSSVEEERARELKPQTALDHFLLGEIRSGDPVAHYNAALALKPDHAPSFMRLGQQYRRSNPEQAELCFTACVGLLAEKPFVYAYRGKFYLDTHKPAKAVVDFTKAVQLEPDRWSYLELRGLAYVQLKRYPEAIDDFTLALHLTEDNKRFAAEVSYNRALAYLRTRRFDEAAADFDRATEWSPRNYGEDVAWHYAFGRPEIRDPVKALALSERTVEALRKRLGEFPKSARYRARLAESLQTLGQCLDITANGKEAEKVFLELVTIWEDLSDEFPEERKYRRWLARGYDGLILILKKSRKWKEAGAVLRKAPKLNYDNPWWTSTLSWWLATWPDKELRDPEQALTLAKHALDANPNDPGSWSNIGTAHYRLSNFEEAVAALQKHNEHAHDAFFLAMASWQLGDTERAREHYDEAVERMDAERKEHSDDEELARFHAEAAELLGISDPPQTDGNKVVPGKDE